MKKALRRLTLHNFQSHEDTTLDLSAGVNVIVGPSDVGKTSLIRALRWLYYNQPRGAGFIRVGTGECWVEVETEDEIIIRRYRNEAGRKNGYTLVFPGQEPMVFERHGSAVPEEVRQALGVEEMMIDQDVVLNLNIAYQLEGAFLLETPGTTRAKAIGRLGNAHIVDAAQREIQKDLRSVGQEIEKSKTRLAAETRLLDNYGHLPDWADQLGQLEQILVRRQAGEDLQSQLTAFKAGYEKAKKGLADLQPALRQLTGIEAAEGHLEALQAARQRTDMLAGLLQQHQVKSGERQVQERLLEDTGQLPAANLLLNRLNELQAKMMIYQQLYQERAAKKERLAQAQRQVEAGQSLPQAEGIHEELVRLRETGKALSEQFLAYRERRVKWQQAAEQVGALAGCEQAETLMNKMQQGNHLLTELNELYRKEQASRQGITQNRERIVILASGYDRDSEAYLQCLQEMGQCPVCHGSIDDEHLQELKKQLEEDWNGEQQTTYL